MPVPAPRTTSLQLSEEAERDLVEYALQRIDGLRIDNKERLDADKKAWAWYNNKREERKEAGSVFEHSNLVLPLTPMIAESFIARSEDEITGMDPFYRFRPKGKSDAASAKQHNAYYAHKFGPEGANVKRTFEDAYEAIFVQRAAVFKAVWKDQVAEWLDGSVQVLTDKLTGQPIKKLAQGKPGYVAEDEARWMPVQKPHPLLPDQSIEVKVLEDDPSIEWDDTMEFRPPPKSLLRSQVIYRGAKAMLLDYDAFLCPTNAASIEEADFKCEIYDRPISWVRGMFIERPWLTWRSFAALHRTAKAKAQSKTERNDESKEGLEFDQKTRTLKLVECWVRRDVLKWGKPQDFMILIDPEEKRAVYYEFQANLCPDLQSPFVAIAIAPHKGRWWGYNLPEKVEQFQDFADKQFNGASQRNAIASNPIGVMDASAVEEEPDEIEVGAGGLFHKKPGKTVQDFIEFAAVPNMDNRTIELLDFVIRMLQLWLSVSNISQGDIESVPQDATKYAAQAALKEASKLGRRWIRRIIRGFESVLRKMVKLQANNLDQAEAFELLEGEMATLLQMTPEELQAVDLDVSLVLGTQLGEIEIQAAEKALEVQQRYLATPPQLQKAVRPLLARILEALDFDDIDNLLPLPPEPPPNMLGMPGDPTMGGQPPQMAPGGIAA